MSFFSPSIIIQDSKIFIILLLLLMMSFLTQAEDGSNALKFSSLSTEQGLSQSFAYNIVQDNSGLIWIATQDGLNKYDGENVTQYRHNATITHSISNNFIRKVFLDSKGNLWVGTQNGLNKFIPSSNNFEHYFNDKQNTHSLSDNTIWDIYQDNNDTLWISTETGLQQFNPKNNNFTRLKIRGYEDRLNEIKTIFQDDNNNYWFGTFDDGIYIVNSNLSYAVSLQESNKWNLLLDANALYDIKEIDSKYWLATDNGLFSVSKNYKLIKHYTENSQTNGLLSNKVRSIEQFDDSHIWLGTKNGLNIINLLNDNISKHQHNDHPKAITENWIMDIYKDNSGIFWLGTNGKGVNIYNPISGYFEHQLFGFSNKSIGAFAETTDERVWFILQDKLLKSINIDGTINHDAISLNDNAFQMKAGAQNELWLISYAGDLHQINTDSKTQIKHHQWKEQSNYNDVFHFIFLNNKLWYIDNDGYLVSYNTLSSTFTKVISDDTTPFRGIINDGNDSLWLTSSSNLLFHFNISNQNLTQHKIKGPVNIDNTNNIAVSPNWLWLTSGFGVVLINKESLKVNLFDENNQLKNNTISAVLIDEQENAWISSGSNISLIQPKLLTVQSFIKDYGLTDNDFFLNSALRSSHTQFYFGGLNGFHQFSPDILNNRVQEFTSPIFTDLFIANKKIVIQSDPTNDGEKRNAKFMLSKQLDHLDKLILNYNQSPFSIEFISPNAKIPSQIAYKYRLKGLEEDWIEAGENNHRATYTNLSAGDYTFEIQVYDLKNISQSKNRNLNIEILPPWWFSRASITAYILLFLLAVFYVLQQIRHKRLYNLKIKLSEERLKLSLWGSGDEMWDWNITEEKIFRSNIWGILEFPQDGQRNIGTEGAEETNIHQQDLARVSQALTEYFKNNSEHFEATYRVKDKDNRWIWVLDRGKIVERNSQNQPTRMTGTLKDISQIKKTEERLKLFAKCIQNISDAVVIYDSQFTIVDINQSFQKITELARQDVIGTVLKFTQYPEKFTTNIKRHLLTKGSWHGEVENQRKNGAIYLIDIKIDVIKDENGSISNFVAVFSDITVRKENEAELIKLANSDTLTGLPNRSFFQAHQTQLVKNKVPHALLVFDLDNFKKINDSMGHQVGDVLLCKVAERILKVSRKQDTLYRLGGDEFSLIIERTNDIHTITTIAKKILRSIALPLKLKSQEVVLFSSTGIVLYPEDGISPQELLKNADTAMYHAKDNGGNKYQFFSDSMNKKAVKRLQIESLIRHGLKEDYFSVFFQPKIKISTGKVAGMEALVRFKTPNKGIISPIVFIPVSEETGQIIDIGEVVLRKSCYATKKWIDTGLFDGRVAVNLSAVQFTQPNLVGMIAEILQESELPAKHLELEITEGTVMDSPQQAIETMLQIRAMGVHLSLDDFGTGYSSLAYLKKFPLNTLKIDKAFIDDIEESEQGRNMVATIVTIAHNLGLDVVAEGVETNSQLKFLTGIKCEQLQGYLYSKPLPQEQFQKYLLSHQITDKSTLFNK